MSTYDNYSTIHDELTDGYSHSAKQVNTQHKVLVIPDFVERALQINNSNSIDLLDYARIRKVVNLQDMAIWVKIAQDCSINHLGDPIALGSCLAEYFEYDSRQTDAGRKELKYTVMPMVTKDHTVASSSQEYLFYSDELPGGQQDLMQSEDKVFFQFKSIGETVLLIVYPGVLTHLQKPGALLVFIREWLAQLEKILSPECIASQNLFRVYLKHLRLESN